MKSTLALLAILAMVPVAAPAKSAYAACLDTEQRLGGSTPALYGSGGYRSYGGFGSYGAVNSAYYSQSGVYGTSYLGSSYLSSYLSSESSWAEHNRVMRFVRACRHLKTSKPPSFRVVGLKSPAQRSAVNSDR